MLSADKNESAINELEMGQVIQMIRNALIFSSLSEKVMTCGGSIYGTGIFILTDVSTPVRKIALC